jgi:FemAB-related protein (PEP-CTERM system-associated)
MSAEAERTTGHPTGSTSVEPYRGDDAEWDEFVRRAPTGTIFHLSAWKRILSDEFGFRPHHLAARRNLRLVGVLPLFELRPTFGRPCLVSSPFAVEGGVCAGDDEARCALDAAAVALSGALGAVSLELRDGLAGAPFRLCEGIYFRFRRPILATDEENLAAIPRKQRRMVRVGQKNDLHVRVGPDDLDNFYDLHARTLRRLGTPAFPRSYFRLLLDCFPKETVLLTVCHGGLPVASVLSFAFRGTVSPYYVGSCREFHARAVNPFLYWELMRHARESGAGVFDFGRSKSGTGAFDFKRHWGCPPEPLRYRIYTPSGQLLRQRTVQDPTVRLLRSVWRRLPLALTKQAGPFFLRRFGAYYT